MLSSTSSISFANQLPSKACKVKAHAWMQGCRCRRCRRSQRGASCTGTKSSLILPSMRMMKSRLPSTVLAATTLKLKLLQLVAGAQCLDAEAHGPSHRRTRRLAGALLKFVGPWACYKFGPMDDGAKAMTSFRLRALMCAEAENSELPAFQTPILCGQRARRTLLSDRCLQASTWSKFQSLQGRSNIRSIQPRDLAESCSHAGGEGGVDKTLQCHL